MNDTKPEGPLLPATADLPSRAIAASPFAMAIFAGCGERIVFANRAWRALAGDDASGARRSDAGLSALFPELTADLLEQIGREGQSIARRAIEAARRAGEPASWWDVDLTPWPDPAGDLSLILVTAHNVTHHVLTRRKAERAAQRAHAAAVAGKRYELLMRRARDAVLVVRPTDGAILEANDAAVRAYGYSREELVRMHIHALRAPETQGEIPRQLAEAHAGDILFETLHRRRDGSIFPVEVSAAAAESAGRRIIVSVVRDISERSVAAAALAESEARFRGIIETAHEGIWLVDAETHTLFINSRMANLLGSTPEALVGRCVTEFCFPEDTASARERIGRNLAGDAEQFEFRFRRTDGTELPVLAATNPLRDSSGRIVGALGMFSDLTERRQAERVERDLLATLDLAAVMIRAWDGTILFWSEGCARLYGWSAEEAMGRRAHDLLHTQFPVPLAQIEATLLREGEWSGDLRHRRRDGRHIIVAARKVLRRDAEGRPAAIMESLADVTELREAQSALAEANAGLERRVAERTRALADAARELAAEMRRREQAQAALLQAQKLETLGQLTGGVAHDFNNVLAAITGSYELIRRRTDQPAVLELVKRGEEAAERARKLIAQLLAFARRVELKPEPLDLAKVLRGAEDLIHHAVGAGIDLAVRAPPGLWPILADAHQLEIALLNLAVNARDAMHDGGRLTIAARNLDSAERPSELPAGEYVAISVSDTGEGMTPEVLARATDPFFTTKPPGKGTGLGLEMVHGFAAQSGGSLRLESRPGAGTRVDIILPRAALAPGKSEPDASESAALDLVLHGGATILLVEDDEQVRQVAAGLLRELGYTVAEAASAEAALAFVHTLDRLDLLITDIAMPGEDGTALAARLCAERPGLPVLFMTGRPRSDEIADAGMLHKPFTESALASAVLERLGRAPMLRKLDEL